MHATRLLVRTIDRGGEPGTARTSPRRIRGLGLGRRRVRRRGAPRVGIRARVGVGRDDFGRRARGRDDERRRRRRRGRLRDPASGDRAARRRGRARRDRGRDRVHERADGAAALGRRRDEERSEGRVRIRPERFGRRGRGGARAVRRARGAKKQAMGKVPKEGRRRVRQPVPPPERAAEEAHTQGRAERLARGGVDGDERRARTQRRGAEEVLRQTAILARGRRGGGSNPGGLAPDVSGERSVVEPGLSPGLRARASVLREA